MKFKHIFLLVPILCLMLVSVGCAADTDSPAPDAQRNEQAYLDRIAQLEETLQKEREERYIAESTRDAQIAALQQRLELLEGDIKTDVSGDPVGELVFGYRVENGKAIITDYSGSSTLVTVPAELDGYPVIAIGERAFEGKPVAAVTLPEGLETVGWFAFYGCEALYDVTIPASVISIGYAVFDGCEHVSIICREGTYAAQYADSYGLPRVSP